MNQSSSEKVRRLEERLVTEVRVTSTLYDMDLESYAEWAAGHIEPLEFAQAHAVGWMQGRARATRLIAHLLRELREAAGDDERQWQERLRRLGVTRERLVSTF
jgi:hypothetical protein